MSKITRRPSNDLSTWGRGFDDIFEGFFKPLSHFGRTPLDDALPTLDVVEHKTKYIVKAELPGMESDDINVTFDQGILTISGEKRHEDSKEDEEGKTIHRECHYGKYLRQFHLGNNVKEDAIKAKYKNGVLHLTIPKRDNSNPQQVKIEIH